MKKVSLGSMILAGLLAGCATSPIPDVVTHIDPYTRARTDLIPENLLETQGPVRENLYLNASRVFKDLATFDYYLEVVYEAREETGLLNITPGESLVVMADGRELKFKGTGSLNTRKERGGLISEYAMYQVSPGDLRAIASARQVKVKAIGRNGIVERDFAPPNFERFRKFVAHFVDGRS